MTTAPKVRFLDRTSPPHIGTLILMAGFSALVMNIFLPSLPGMAAYFKTDYRLMQLSVSLYLGTSAILQLFIGPVSDKFGRRPVVMGSLVLFLLATIGCIYATTVEVFLLFRMGQTVIAAAMVLSRAVVRDIHPQDRAASMIGYVTMGMALVPMAAPAFGGLLDQTFGWQSNFWLMLGLGAMLLALVWADQGETAPKSGLSLGAQFGEYRELLKSPRFWGYSVASGAASGAFFAYLGGAPFVGSEVFGMEPAMLGLFFGSPAIGYAAGNGLSGRYSMRFGINRMILWGCFFGVLGISLPLIALWLGAFSALMFFGAMTFVGVGNGLVIPNATAGMLSVRPHLAGTASGLGGSLMIGLGAALSAFAGSVLTPETGALPLLVIQMATSVVGLFAITFVIWRQSRAGI